MKRPKDSPAGARSQRIVRLALAQINPTVGDLPGNAKKVIETITKPINKAELLLRVKAALESRKHADPLDQTLAYIEGVQAQQQ